MTARILTKRMVETNDVNQELFMHPVGYTFLVSISEVGDSSATAGWGYPVSSSASTARYLYTVARLTPSSLEISGGVSPA